ncbi:hypothetical protein D0868_11820 [Hortaea werneckii]|uniref:Beta-lactamase-related domain-containing protein n=3 Tax=Hortaea werneckii TaxID=91943 RepID=A0A3M6XXP1_HORWE|nr:hypothetical protein D0868_11820 [Hortaea werneckii]
MVNQKAQDSVQSLLDGVTKDPKTGIPGLVFVAIGKDGNQIAAHASGKTGLADSRPPMTLDTVFWIASCTKLLATIACMQAFEQGKLKLDDSHFVYTLCPELQKVKVLQDDGKLVDKKKDITLRMLLTHTAGFGYEFFNPKLRDYGRPVGFDVFHGDEKEILRMPLVNQPGERFEYGISIDWAGIVLERATGVKLNDWIQEYIMKPLKLENVNMFPTQHMKEQLACMQQRWPGEPGKCEERDHIMREPLLAQTDHEKKHIFHSGGAGAYAKPTEYVQVLAALLNDGTSPNTGAQILKKHTVDEMFTNQIPHVRRLQLTATFLRVQKADCAQMPDFARQGIPAAKPEHTNPAPELYPQEGQPPQGWGLSFMMTVEPGATGRGKNTAWWAGIANLFWWCDREKGVAGMIASQVMPFGDMHVMSQWAACEAAVYSALS